MKMFQLRCPNCNAVLNIDDDIGTSCYCMHCGTKILLEDQQDNILNAKVHLQELKHESEMQAQKLDHEKFRISKEFEDKDKERKTNALKEWLPIFALLLIFLVAMGALIVIDATRPPYIAVPYSSSDFCKMDYYDAVIILQEAGFQNVTVVGSKPSGLFKSKEPGLISSISIDGTTKFSSGKTFSELANIIITYNE